MAGAVEVQWNLGVEEDGEIKGHVDVVQDGVRKGSNLVMFNKNITCFSDSNMDDAAHLTLQLLWRDDLYPLLKEQMQAAFIEQRERCGGYVPTEGDTA